MRIFVTGATGLLGRRVVQALYSNEHEVIIVSRNATHANEHFNNASLEILEADVTKRGDWQTVASECDAIVHLAGAGIVDRRWTKSYKEVLRSSRIESTKNVAEVASNVLVCASATGFYGDCGDRELTEQSPAGNDFLG
ncbi:MAG: SDR family NAD(P)-dependent oxidoreductase, partial [Phycisphaerales bacterium]